PAQPTDRSLKTASIAPLPDSAIPLPSPPISASLRAASPSAGTGTLAAAEGKIPDSVKAIVQRLDKSTDDITLDDLNSARQAVAKIEALIDIEKHLTELDKVRHEREKGASLSAMIPASALQPNYALPAVTQPSLGAGSAPIMAKLGFDVTRVSGGGGHYVAILKSGEESRSVRVGDHLPDGSEVSSITSSEVVLSREGQHRTLHVKNVDTVFGNSF
ncbi:MAG: hypothetical protein M3N08_09485, partial [Pseudomonadota bacterium]|nr:hypothetical protein [Pseudomonadota bacterium]